MPTVEVMAQWQTHSGSSCLQPNSLQLSEGCYAASASCTAVQLISNMSDILQGWVRWFTAQWKKHSMMPLLPHRHPISVSSRLQRMAHGHPWHPWHPFALRVYLHVTEQPSSTRAAWSSAWSSLPGHSFTLVKARLTSTTQCQLQLHHGPCTLAHVQGLLSMQVPHRGLRSGVPEASPFRVRPMLREMVVVREDLRRISFFRRRMSRYSLSLYSLMVNCAPQLLSGWLVAQNLTQHATFHALQLIQGFRAAGAQM